MEFSETEGRHLFRWHGLSALPLTPMSKTKKKWPWAVGAVAVVAVAGAAGTGVVAQRELGELNHAPAYSMELPEPLPVEPAAGEPVDEAKLKEELGAQAANPQFGKLHVRVSNGTTGATVFEQAAGDPLQPASATKMLTAAAALYTLEPDATLKTDVVRKGDAVTIKAAGDVWLTPKDVDELAEKVGDASAVYIDTSIWPEETQMPGWDPLDIDGGFVAPMEPAMISGARLNGEPSGDVPRSHTPALDVAQTLADKVGAQTVGFGPAPEDGEVVASVESPPLTERMREMVKESDNVMAEAIGREVARKRGGTSPQATLDTLTEHGFDISGVTLADSSGLSRFDLIPPRLLDDIMLRATSTDELRDLLPTLAIAGGDGTLYDRYGDLDGKGWVRAKTGTLTGTSALVGTVTSEVGNVYTFAMISNDSDILTARRLMDEFTSTLRQY